MAAALACCCCCCWEVEGCSVLIAGPSALPGALAGDAWDAASPPFAPGLMPWPRPAPPLPEGPPGLGFADSASPPPAATIPAPSTSGAPGLWLSFSLLVMGRGRPAGDGRPEGGPEVVPPGCDPPPLPSAPSSCSCRRRRRSLWRCSLRVCMETRCDMSCYTMPCLWARWGRAKHQAMRWEVAAPLAQRTQAAPSQPATREQPKPGSSPSKTMCLEVHKHMQVRPSPPGPA